MGLGGAAAAPTPAALQLLLCYSPSSIRSSSPHSPQIKGNYNSNNNNQNCSLTFYSSRSNE